MDKDCKNCFYEALPWNEGPCFHCDAGGSKWVAVDFLKNVPDDSASIEGEGVMGQMATELNRMNAKQGVKYDSEKPKWTLLPFRALQEVVEVLTFGAKKYAADNWKHVPQARERYVDAAYRHLADWNTTARLDPETGKSHLAHAICCLLFLLWFEQEERVQ
jgi:hypothetical protein